MTPIAFQRGQEAKRALTGETQISEWILITVLVFCCEVDSLNKVPNYYKQINNKIIANPKFYQTSKAYYRPRRK